MGGTNIENVAESNENVLEQIRLRDLTNNYVKCKIVYSNVEKEMEEYKTEILSIMEKLHEKEASAKVGSQNYKIGKIERVTYDFNEAGIKDVLIKKHGNVNGTKLFKSLFSVSFSVDKDKLQLFLKDNPDLKDGIKTFVHSSKKLESAYLIDAMQDGKILYNDIKEYCNESIKSYIKMSKTGA